MQTSAERMVFDFDNSAEKLVSSLEYMLGYIAGRIPAQADREDILFRSKVIITELLTNGIKHAGEHHTRFDVEADQRRLLISKTDNGAPLYLVNARQTTDDRKLISADPLNSLYAVWEGENQIRFASEEGSLDDFLSFEQVMEHFGILIITRSADEFTYTWDKGTSSNIFRVLIGF